MARLVYEMNLSLDGYVDHESFAPDRELFRHWIDQIRRLSASIYGRKLYQLMQYWDVDDPAWGPDERAFADAWRSLPKWVVSRSLREVGPNATLIADAAEAGIAALKSRLEGEVDIGGPALAGSLAGLGLIDEYRLYFHPVILGRGARFFTAPPPPLALVESRRIGGNVVCLTYVPA